MAALRVVRSRRGTGGAAVLVVAVLLGGLGGCSGDGTVAGPTIPTGPDLAAGLGDPLLVPEVPDVQLSDHPALSGAAAPDGTAWVVASASPQTRGEGAGVWHGRLGEKGTWFPLGAVTDVAVGPDGRPWVLAGTALTTFDGSDWRRVLGPNGLPWSGLAAPSTGPDGSVWAILSQNGVNGLARYDGQPETMPVGNPPCESPTDLIVDGEGAVWTSGFNGYVPDLGTLCQVIGAAWDVVEPLGAPAPASAFARDPDGSVWAWLTDYDLQWRPDGTMVPPTQARRGLVRLAQGRAVRTVTQGLPPVDAWSMADGGEVLWVVASAWAGPYQLWRYDGRAFARVTLRENGRPVAPQAIVQADEDGSAWVVTADGSVLHVPAAASSPSSG